MTIHENERARIENATIDRKTLTGERAAFMAHDVDFVRTSFEDGESPLKHSENITLQNSVFKWKYPLWYSKNVTMKNGAIFEMGRAGIWYTNGITVENVVIEAPKEFRRCRGVTLSGVQFSNAAETLWQCDDVIMRDVYAKGDYFAMNSSNMRIDGLTLVGNYPFDGAKHIELRNSKLLSKDSFWNAEDVTIYDSYISGEYFGWNSKNITLENCTVESTQGFCYIENLVMKNCMLVHTNLAFEYSTVTVDVRGRIDSIKNPRGGTIRAQEIGEVILEADKIDVGKIRIITDGGAGDAVG